MIKTAFESLRASSMSLKNVAKAAASVSNFVHEVCLLYRRAPISKDIILPKSPIVRNVPTADYVRCCALILRFILKVVKCPSMTIRRPNSKIDLKP